MVLLSAVLMSLPWLVPHCGFLALIGLVPLLSAERVASQNGVKHFWIWHYSCFVLWNAFTTFWVCNATVGGGIFACVANFPRFRMDSVGALVHGQRADFLAMAGTWQRIRP